MLQSVEIAKEHVNIAIWTSDSYFICCEITQVPIMSTVSVMVYETDGQTWHFVKEWQVVPEAGIFFAVFFIYYYNTSLGKKNSCTALVFQFLASYISKLHKDLAGRDISLVSSVKTGRRKSIANLGLLIIRSCFAAEDVH